MVVLLGSWVHDCCPGADGGGLLLLGGVGLQEIMYEFSLSFILLPTFVSQSMFSCSLVKFYWNSNPIMR